MTSIECIMDLRVAIIGYGSIGRRHCENLARLGVKRRVVVRRVMPNPSCTTPDDVVVVHSVREAIESGIDLAIVCNPTSLHLATAREFVAAGVGVLIEKPLAADVATAELFFREAEVNRAAVGVAYCMRYHPAYVLARDCLSQGRLGRMLRANAWFESYLPDWHPWEDYRQGYAARADLGGGVLPTLDHEIDFVNWCFGLPVDSSATTSRSGRLDIDVDDTAQVVMRYPGHSVEICLSMAEPNRRRGFEFVGNEATLRFSLEQQRLDLSCGGKDEVLWHEPEFDLNNAYLVMLRDAVHALAGARPMPIPVRAGVEALRVASRGCA